LATLQGIKGTVEFTAAVVALYESYSSASFLEIAGRFRLANHQNEIMQSTTAQIGDTEIVQFQTAQMPSFLNLTSFAIHI